METLPQPITETNGASIARAMGGMTTFSISDHSVRGAYHVARHLHFCLLVACSSDN